MDASLEKIEVQDDKFKLSLKANDSGGEDFTVTVSKTELFEKLKDAFTPTTTVVTASDCANCKVIDIPPPYPDWFCLRYEKQRENCNSYEPKM
jgi:hypothetical protein